MLSFLGTDYGLKAVRSDVYFCKMGTFKMPCHEFCGPGRAHAGAITGAIHFVPWAKPTYVSQFWLFHAVRFRQAGQFDHPLNACHSPRDMGLKEDIHEPS
jgi:hypothetical protein